MHRTQVFVVFLLVCLSAIGLAIAASPAPNAAPNAAPKAGPIVTGPVPTDVERQVFYDAARIVFKTLEQNLLTLLDYNGFNNWDEVKNAVPAERFDQVRQTTVITVLDIIRLVAGYFVEGLTEDRWHRVDSIREKVSGVDESHRQLFDTLALSVNPDASLTNRYATVLSNIESFLGEKPADGGRSIAAAPYHMVIESFRALQRVVELEKETILATEEITRSFHDASATTNSCRGVACMVVSRDDGNTAGTKSGSTSGSSTSGSKKAK